MNIIKSFGNWIMGWVKAGLVIFVVIWLISVFGSGSSDDNNVTKTKETTISEDEKLIEIRKEYWDNGKLKSVVPYKKHYGIGWKKVKTTLIPHGISKEYDENGTLIKEDSYVDGERTGLVKFYGVDGSLEVSYEFNNNVRNGKTTYYYSDGSVMDVEYYKDGNLTEAPVAAKMQEEKTQNASDDETHVATVVENKEINTTEETPKEQSVDARMPEHISKAEDNETNVLKTPQSMSEKKNSSNMVILDSKDSNSKVEVLIYGNGEQCNVIFNGKKNVSTTDCVQLTNSKKIKILCTKNKKICKTVKEVAKFIEYGQNDNQQGLDKLRQGMKYSKARKIVFSSGWQGLNNRWQDISQYGQENEVFYNNRWTEVASCAGTGSAPCRFEFRNMGEKKLILITQGECDYDKENPKFCELYVDSWFYE